MEPIPTDSICTFPGPVAPRCPGFAPAGPERWPEHLRYLPFISSATAETGCVHLVAMPTSRGGFRPGCGHPSGNPSCWKEATLLGRRSQNRVGQNLNKAFAG